MASGHDHDHHHRGADSRRLALTLGLVLLYMAAEVVGGLLTGSLALLADAGHMLSDAGALGLAVFAMRLARRPPTARRTYGFYRTEILAALVNGAALVAVAALIFLEALERFQMPREVAGGPMMAVAAGGLVVNLLGLVILRSDRDASLNLRGAWLHVLTDALGSVQAIVAGLLIWRFGWTWVDPAASIVIGLLVVYSSWSLLREAVAVLMEGAPGHIDVDEVHAAIRSTGGVTEVHDLHVWTITSGLVSLSAHVCLGEGRPAARVLQEVQDLLQDRFGIRHATIQLEPPGFECCDLSV